MHTWVVPGLLMALTPCLASGGEGITLQAVPHRVYVALDGSAPTWRTMVVALNHAAAPVALQQLCVELQTATDWTRTVYSEGRLQEIVPGGLQAAAGGHVVMYLAPTTQHPARLRSADVCATFRSGEQLIEQRCRLPLTPRATTYLRLPLRGEWVVANGRETQHAGGIAFAFDFMAPRDLAWLDHDRARERELRHFSGWGRPVLAPASGRVVACAGDRPDCQPSPDQSSFAGKTIRDRSELVGNYLAIEVGRRRCVLMAHLQRGSLRVQAGDEVREGQVVAAVGNSGNTNAPHLHLELLDGPPDLALLASPRFAQSGLPCGFADIGVCQGGVLTPQHQYVPTRGQVIRGE